MVLGALNAGGKSSWIGGLRDVMFWDHTLDHNQVKSVHDKQLNDINNILPGYKRNFASFQERISGLRST